MLNDKISKIMLLAVIYAISSSHALAVTPNEAVSNEYLKYKGHTKELSRLVEIECARAQGEELTHEKPNMKIWKWTLSDKASRFMRNLIFEKDVTMSTEEFGFNQ